MPAGGKLRTPGGSPVPIFRPILACHRTGIDNNSHVHRHPPVESRLYAPLGQANTMTFGTTYERLTAFAETSSGKRLAKLARGIFVAGVVGLLIYQLSGVGWIDIWNALPTQPLYYVILLAMYLLLPFTESLIYGRLWSLRVRDCLSIMIRKRVLNVDVIGYSGEVYFFIWAKARLKLEPRQIMATIKDNLILSSFASIAAAVLLVCGLAATGHIEVGKFIDNPNPIYAGIGLFAAALIGAVIVRFRKAIFWLPKRVLAAVGAIHLSRFFLGYALLIAQWWVVIPSASFETWAILLTVFVLINRIPFLPSSDLVFVSAGAGLSPLLDMPVAPVVSMLLVRSVVDRLLNLILFSTTVWRERRSVYTEVDPAEGVLTPTPGEQDEKEREPQALVE